MTIGTSTLEYGAFMTDLFLEVDNPVVFTSAMRRADQTDPDGPSNLRDAIDVAKSDESWGRGVVVCFHGKLMSARGVWKLHREDVDAFVAWDGDLGAVHDGSVTYFRESVRPQPFARAINDSVVLVKAYPGADGFLIDAAVSRGVRGIIVEGLPGVGGLPPMMHASVRDAVDKGVVTVVASRAPAGKIPNPPTGGTGSPLADLHLVSAGSLTAEKAWVLLMAVLGESTDPETARLRFENVASEGAG